MVSDTEGRLTVGRRRTRACAQEHASSQRRRLNGRARGLSDRVENEFGGFELGGHHFSTPANDVKTEQPPNGTRERFRTTLQVPGHATRRQSQPRLRLVDPVAWQA